MGRIFINAWIYLGKTYGRYRIFLKFAVLGLVVWFAILGIKLGWLGFWKTIYGPTLVFDTQPAVLKLIYRVLPFLSCIATFVLLLKNFKARRFQPGLGLLFGFFSGYVLLLGSLFLGPQLSEYISRRPFDADLWKRAEGMREEVRSQMVRDFLKRHSLRGMPKTEVDQLLGIPSKRNSFRGYDYVYWLGHERGFLPIDSQFLVIKFESDRVVEARILTD